MDPGQKRGLAVTERPRRVPAGFLSLRWNETGAGDGDGLGGDLGTLHLSVFLRHWGVLLLEGKVGGDALLNLLEALGEFLPEKRGRKRVSFG